MKKRLGIIMAVLALICALTGGFGGFGRRTGHMTANATEFKDNKTISVNASCEIAAMPDTAYVNLSVNTFNANLTAAQKSNAEAVSKTIQNIAALNIKKEDITNGGYSLYPSYEHKNGLSRLTGYNVSNSIKIKVTDFDLLGKIIDIAGENGANNISGIEYVLDDSAELYNKALAQAVKNAKEKAGVMAQAQGCKIISLLNIKENEVYNNRIMPLAASRTFAAEADSSTSINAGKITVKACVEAVYLID